MENTTTARIDMQRLQQLNDRLCQTLDALNQVRISAHNIGTVNPFLTGYPTSNVGFNPMMNSAPTYANPTFANQPTGYGAYPTVSAPWMTGTAFNGFNPMLGHFPGMSYQYGAPYSSGFIPAFNPSFNPALNGYSSSFSTASAPSFFAARSPALGGMMGMETSVPRANYVQPVGF
jgi:hypothetical protein